MQSTLVDDDVERSGSSLVCWFVVRRRMKEFIFHVKFTCIISLAL